MDLVSREKPADMNNFTKIILLEVLLMGGIACSESSSPSPEKEPENPVVYDCPDISGFLNNMRMIRENKVLGRTTYIQRAGRFDVTIFNNSDKDEIVDIVVWARGLTFSQGATTSIIVKDVWPTEFNTLLDGNRELVIGETVEVDSRGNHIKYLDMMNDSTYVEIHCGQRVYVSAKSSETLTDNLIYLLSKDFSHLSEYHLIICDTDGRIIYQKVFHSKLRLH